MLEKCDERLLRAIVGGHSKAAHEFVYMETVTWPLRWVCASRRLGYLHTLLSRGEEELTKRAQQGNPTPGDWWLTVQENMEDIGLGNMKEKSIMSKSKHEFKELVKDRIKYVLFVQFTQKQS